MLLSNLFFLLRHLCFDYLCLRNYIFLVSCDVFQLSLLHKNTHYAFWQFGLEVWSNLDCSHRRNQMETNETITKLQCFRVCLFFTRKIQVSLHDNWYSPLQLPYFCLRIHLTYNTISFIILILAFQKSNKKDFIVWNYFIWNILSISFLIMLTYFNSSLDFTFWSVIVSIYTDKCLWNSKAVCCKGWSWHVKTDFVDCFGSPSSFLPFCLTTVTSLSWEQFHVDKSWTKPLQ